ncbi:hypothetical protein CON64_12710 [Bacillus pseudomycoides]|nr:hypothetical protein CON64_12710 [Bacillus pseudomycoides]
MYRIAFLLIVFSGFFINLLPISPNYLLFVMSCIGLFFYILKNKKIYFNALMSISLIFLGYLLITQFMLITEQTNAVYNVMLSLVYFILSFMVLYDLDIDNILKLSKKFINISIMLLVIEAYWRLTHPWSLQNTWQLSQVDSGFYKYKMNSFMYQDSNFVGIFIISLFFFCVYLRNCKKITLKWQMSILAILCILTFSRAAIFTLFTFYILIGFKSKWIRILLVIASASMGIFFISSYFNSDVSFLSKIEIIDRAWEFIKNTTASNVLLGIGFGNSFEYLSIGAHNFIITYLIESGLIGFTILVVLWWEILRKTNFKAGIIMVPFLVNGMSLAGHAIPYLYCMFAIIYMLEEKDKPIVDLQH